VAEIRRNIIFSANQMPSRYDIASMATPGGLSSTGARGISPYAAQKALNFSAGLPSGYSQLNFNQSSMRPLPVRGRRRGGVNFLTR
jgi:hypothetical protein